MSEKIKQSKESRSPANSFFKYQITEMDGEKELITKYHNTFEIVEKLPVSRAWIFYKLKHENSFDRKYPQYKVTRINEPDHQFIKLAHEKTKERKRIWIKKKREYQKLKKIN